MTLDASGSEYATLGTVLEDARQNQGDQPEGVFPDADKTVVTRLVDPSPAVQRQVHRHGRDAGVPTSPAMIADRMAVQGLLALMPTAPDRQRMQVVLAYAHDAGISGRDVLAATQASANTTADQIAAATVFVISRAAGHPTAPAILDGRVHVHVVALDRGIAAMYAATAHPERGLAADTLGVAATTTLASLGDRSSVIHELEHAQQDDSRHLDPGYVATTGRAEFQAYRRQAHYVVDQLQAIPPADVDAAIRQLVPVLTPILALTLVLVAQPQRTALQPLINRISQAVGTPAGQIAHLFSLSPIELQDQIMTLIHRRYDQAGVENVESPANFDGWTGPGTNSPDAGTPHHTADAGTPSHTAGTP